MTSYGYVTFVPSENHGTYEIDRIDYPPRLVRGLMHFCGFRCVGFNPSTRKFEYEIDHTERKRLFELVVDGDIKKLQAHVEKMEENWSNVIVERLLEESAQHHTGVINTEMIDFLVSLNPRGNGILDDLFVSRRFGLVHWSATVGSVSMLNYLVSNSPSGNSVLEMPDWDKKTPARHALSCGRIEALKFIVNNAPSGHKVLDEPSMVLESMRCGYGDCLEYFVKENPRGVECLTYRPHDVSLAVATFQSYSFETFKYIINNAPNAREQIDELNSCEEGAWGVIVYWCLPKWGAKCLVEFGSRCPLGLERMVQGHKTQDHHYLEFVEEMENLLKETNNPDQETEIARALEWHKSQKRSD